ncbi:MAG: IS3 family transposase [Rhabdochlamydiaceae bacterium]
MVAREESSLSIKRQCRLLDIRRSGLYYKPAGENKENLEILRRMDEQYLKTPFYGVRRLTAWLRQEGYDMNPKRVKRLMKVMGWQTIYRTPNTSWPDKQHQVYPYLLKGLKTDRVNQVWAMDITYVPMRKGFMYLCAIIDVYSR